MTDKQSSEASDGFSVTDSVFSDASGIVTTSSRKFSDAFAAISWLCYGHFESLYARITSLHMETTVAYAAANYIKGVFRIKIKTISLTGMNNAAYFLFVSNMVGRAEKDTTVVDKCAAR